ncbi:MAG TPA: Uma2 family endonuclease [Vicinamibacterales bacterium]|nr:Uma2 family endonuclease [Vicinamibacterales bacterium]
MPAPRMTTEEYLKLPEKVVPEELVYGLVRSAASPTPGHQWVLGRLFLALTRHVEKHRSGRLWPAPLDVVLDRERGLIVQPDLLYVSLERMRLVTDRVWGPPDLVLEILSPRPRIGTLDERIAWFAEYGVRECWLVHQHPREVEVLQFERGAVANRTTFEADAPIRSSVLPTFNASLEEMLGS